MFGGKSGGTTVEVVPLRLQILGPLRVWRGGVERDPGPGRQAYLLALLLAAAGQPISVDQLVAHLWDDNAPAGAVTVIDGYAGALRRIREPALAPGEDGSYLHRHGNSYCLTAGAELLDLSSFREHVAAARTHVARGDDRALFVRRAEALIATLA